MHLQGAPSHRVHGSSVSLGSPGKEPNSRLTQYECNAQASEVSGRTETMGESSPQEAGGDERAPEWLWAPHQFG